MAAPLVEYPSSDSDADPDPSSAAPLPRPHGKQANEAAALPPLPAAFHALYPTAARPSTADDPALHEGRTRQLPHTPGVWPTHVYVEWRPDAAQRAAIEAVLAAVADATAAAEISKGGGGGGTLPPPTPLDTSPLGAAQPLHISLSRTLPVRGPQRAGFLRDLEAAVASAASHSRGRGARVRGGGAGFRVRLAGLRAVANEDGSRTFLAARLAPDDDGGGGGGEELVRALVAACNGVARASGWDVLDDAAGRAHVSLAWWLGGGAAAGLDEGLLGRAWARVVGGEGLEVPVERVTVRMGNEVVAVELDGRPGRAGGGAVLGVGR